MFSKCCLVEDHFARMSSLVQEKLALASLARLVGSPIVFVNVPVVCFSSFGHRWRLISVSLCLW